MLLMLHKPYGILSRFTPEPGSRWGTLAGLGLPRSVYPVGRLDADSEGLLLLTDEPGLTDHLIAPARRHPREYWAQVEYLPTPDALARLAGGVRLRDGPTLPARARLLEEEPALSPRDPPIRVRATVPTAWIALELVEGRNRQVRRMTAAVGHPTLRLFRIRIGALTLPLSTLPPGKWVALDDDDRQRALGSSTLPPRSGRLSTSGGRSDGRTADTGAARRPGSRRTGGRT